MSSSSTDGTGRGLLGRAEAALNAPADGTPLRPYITSVRKAVTGAATSVTAQVDSLVEQVDSTVDGAVKSVDEALTLDGNGTTSEHDGVTSGAGGIVPSFAMLRPEIKFGCIVGANALLSPRGSPTAHVGAAA